ncbi:hypothetical protein DIZ66_08675 [Legionella pneumophila]|nr:hypothetical protein DM456_09730 [Legionella pneumophila]TIE11321.1 hypothetical protein DIZ66_08675 [Legionella pneumophila]
MTASGARIFFTSSELSVIYLCSILIQWRSVLCYFNLEKLLMKQAYPGCLQPGYLATLFPKLAV